MAAQPTPAATKEPMTAPAPAQRQARVATTSREEEDDRAVGAQRQAGQDGDVPDGGDHYSSPGSKPRSEGSAPGSGAW